MHRRLSALAVAALLCTAAACGRVGDLTGPDDVPAPTAGPLHDGGVDNGGMIGSGGITAGSDNGGMIGNGGITAGSDNGGMIGNGDTTGEGVTVLGGGIHVNDSDGNNGGMIGNGG